jgi:hypothetical protein
VQLFTVNFTEVVRYAGVNVLDVAGKKFAVPKGEFMNAALFFDNWNTANLPLSVFSLVWRPRLA